MKKILLALTTLIAVNAEAQSFVTFDCKYKVGAQEFVITNAADPVLCLTIQQLAKQLTDFEADSIACLGTVKQLEKSQKVVRKLKKQLKKLGGK